MNDSGSSAFCHGLFIYYFLVVILYACCYSISSRVEAKPDSGKNKMPFFSVVFYWNSLCRCCFACRAESQGIFQC